MELDFPLFIDKSTYSTGHIEPIDNVHSQIITQYICSIVMYYIYIYIYIYIYVVFNNINYIYILCMYNIFIYNLV